MHLDRWDDLKVKFVFGYDAKPNLKSEAYGIEDQEWSELIRARTIASSEVKRRPRIKYRDQVVEDRGFRCKRLVREWVSEFTYRPLACKKAYRMIVLWKEIQIIEGQARLWDEEAEILFFYITNDMETAAEDVVTQEANKRCDQEKQVIRQLKSDVPALKAPLDSLKSNEAYMAFACLAWNLKVWLALCAPTEAPADCTDASWSATRRSLLRMNFGSFFNRLINIPCQILRKGRRTIFRLLAWRPDHESFVHIWLNLKGARVSRC